MAALTFRELAISLVSLEERIDLVLAVAGSGRGELVSQLEAVAAAAARFGRELEIALASEHRQTDGVGLTEDLLLLRERLARAERSVEELARRSGAPTPEVARMHDPADATSNGEDPPRGAHEDHGDDPGGLLRT